MEHIEVSLFIYMFSFWL